MNVGIVGGGPAGLFFAYLMKRADASHRIRVVERDPADATYGWGVVFTDIALAFVRDVAPELYAAMTRHQEVHDAMRIVHRGQAVALANNTFHRMARIDLLRTLRQHGADLGVAIELGRHVADERQRDVGEDDAPAIRGVGWITLDDADAVARVLTLHEVGEEQSGGTTAHDPDVHPAPDDPRIGRGRLSVPARATRSRRGRP